MENTKIACTGRRVSHLDRCHGCHGCRLAAELRDHTLRVTLYGAARAKAYTPTVVPADLRADVIAAITAVR